MQRCAKEQKTPLGHTGSGITAQSISKRPRERSRFPHPQTSNTQQKMNHLPVPDHPYRNWCDLLPALWEYGMANPDSEVFATFMNEFNLDFANTFWPPDESDKAFARPSRGSQCPQMHFLIAQEGVEQKPMPTAMAATFSMGHLAHSMAYAAIASVLPECFLLIAESSADVSNTIPEPGAQRGTIDFLLITKDMDEAAKYIHRENLETMPNVMGDFKTMTGRGWRDHAKTVFDEKFPDTLGQTGQLSVYRFSKEVLDLEKQYGFIGTLLVAVNKESPHMGIIPRVIPHDYLTKRRDHAEACYSNTEDVGPWLLDTYGKAATGWYCDAFGKGGYCPVAHECRARRMAKPEKVELLTVEKADE